MCLPQEHHIYAQENFALTTSIIVTSIFIECVCFTYQVCDILRIAADMILKKAPQQIFTRIISWEYGS
jgi:hypothetical protein